MSPLNLAHTVRERIALGLRPGLAAARQREWSLLRGDVVAGLTVAAYLVPQVLAYARVAGLPPITGLWAAVAALAGYALIGSSRLLSMGPDSTTAIMTAVSIAPLAAGDPARYAALATLLALLVGTICVVGSLARLGFLADLLSRPVLVGYLAGIALIMIAGQLENVTGVPNNGSTFLAQVSTWAGNLERAHGTTLLLATAVLAFLLISDRLFPRLPGPLIAVLLAAAITATWSLRQRGVQVVGTVPTGIPTPHLPTITMPEVAALLPAAFGVAIVAYSDTVLTGRAFAARGGDDLDANQEMLALGVSNMTVGFLAGFPVTSSGSRTAIGHSVGARSQLYSLVTLGSVLVVLFVAGPVVATFPTAALGALVIYAALRLVDLSEFRRFALLRFSELALAVLTTAAVLVLGVLNGVLAAIALSGIDLLRKLARPHDAILGFVPDLAGMHNIADYPQATTLPGLVVYRYDAPLCFANADDFRARALAALDAAPTPPAWMIIDIEATVELDTTALDALTTLSNELEHRHVVLALARAKQDLMASLGHSDLLEHIKPHNLYPTLPTAVQAFKEAAKDNDSNP